MKIQLNLHVIKSLLGFGDLYPIFKVIVALKLSNLSQNLHVYTVPP